MVIDEKALGQKAFELAMKYLVSFSRDPDFWASDYNPPENAFYSFFGFYEFVCVSFASYPRPAIDEMHNCLFRQLLNSGHSKNSLSEIENTVLNSMRVCYDAFNAANSTNGSDLSADPVYRSIKELFPLLGLSQYDFQLNMLFLKNYFVSFFQDCMHLRG